MCGFEGGTGDVVACVQHGSVRQHDAGGDEHFVTVGMGAAVHARSVVHDDAAHHGRFHRGGVGGELASVRRENLVYPLTDDARLQRNLFVVGGDAVLLPMLAGYYQDGVANGLSGQTGSCGTKRHRQTVAVGQPQQVGDFSFVAGTNHDLRNEAVEARIRSPCQPAQFVGVYPFLRDKFSYLLQK